MLKGSSLKSSGPHMSAIKCISRTYDDNSSPKFKKPSIAIAAVSNVFKNKFYWQALGCPEIGKIISNFFLILELFQVQYLFSFHEKAHTKHIFISSIGPILETEIYRPEDLRPVPFSIPKKRRFERKKTAKKVIFVFIS